MSAFTAETDGLQFFLGPSKVLPLRSFQLFHPPSIYGKSPHLAPTLGRSICRWASHLGYSSSRCQVESSFCPHSHRSDSASFRRYKYFRSRLWSVRSWISMADSWVLRLLYSLKVCFWGSAPSNLRVNTPAVGFFSKCELRWSRSWPLPLSRPNPGRLEAESL